MKHAAWIMLTGAMLAVYTEGGAQTGGGSFSLACASFGYAAREPLGDKDGHAMSTGAFSCRVTGGPLDGGVLSGTQAWEWQGSDATGLGGNSVLRHNKGVLVALVLP